MANFLANVSDGLTYIGRTFLRNLRSKQVLLRRVNTTYLSGWGYGSTFSIPSIDISGGAAVRAIGGAATADDIVTLTRSFTKQQIYKAVRIDNLQRLWASVDMMARVGDILAYKVAKKCDAIVAGLHTQVGYEVGTLDGTSAWDPTATTDPFKPLNDALVILGQNNAMTDNLTAVWSPKEAGVMRRIPNLLQAQQSGDTDLLRNAQMGPIMGFENLWSTQIQNATESVNAETLTPGAVVGAHTRNATTLAVNGLGTGTVKAGTTFTIAGVVNEEGYLVGFSVAADATITANAATLTLNRPLPVDVANATAVTFREHTAAGSMNLAFHRDAIAVAIQGDAQFIPGTGVATENVTDEETGLSIQINLESNLLGAAGTAYSTAIAASIVFGAGIAMPDLIVKISGQV